MRNSRGLLIAAIIVCGSVAAPTYADDFDPNPWEKVVQEKQVTYPYKPSAFSRTGELQAGLPVFANGADRELLAAAARNDFAAVEKLLKEGANPNAKDEGNMQPLIFAVNFGSIEIVRLLLEAGADPNVSTEGSTMLATAAMNGYLRIAALLLEAGARVDERYENESTPLMNAVFMNHVSTVETILKHDPDLPLENSHGMTALSIARSQGYTQLVELLLKHGAAPRIVYRKPWAHEPAGNRASSRWTFEN